MGLAVQKDPIVGTEQLMSDIHHTRLNERGGVEDLASDVAVRGDNDKSGANN
jgi:hypothetical protein